MMIFAKILLVVAAGYALAAALVGPRRAWQLWQKIGRFVGDALAGLVLTALYFTLLVPFALVAMSRDGNRDAGERDGEHWVVRRPTAGGLNAAGKQSLRELAARSPTDRQPG